MHAVVRNTQVWDARALALAGFEFKQKSAVAVFERPQLIEFGIEPIGQDPAIAYAQRGLGRNRAGKFLCPHGIDL